ncbi:MAG: GNAT family N-acetyltransferase [Thermoguttaceae bacterium]
MHLLPDRVRPQSSAGEDYTVTIHRGRAGLKQLTADRDRLTQSLDAGQVDDFLDWYTCYLDVYVRDPDTVFFCEVWRGDRAVAILPVRTMARWLFGIRIPALELLNTLRMPTGGSIVTDGSDPQSYASLLFEELKRTVRPRWHYLRLANVRSDCTFAAAMALALTHLRVHVSGADWCPVVPEEQFLQRLGKNFARKLRQNRRKVEGTAEAAFSTVSTLPELEQAYEDFLKAEASSWKGQQGTCTALLFDQPMREFYRQLMRRLAARQRCEIHLLRLDDRPIAGQYTLVTGDTVYVLKIGYDGDYARLSPGVVLQDRLFRYCANRPSIQRLDFTTDMPWMKNWQPTREDVFDWICFRPTLRARIAHAYWWLARVALYHRRTWAAPLYRRLFGTHQQRYKRKQEKESSPDEQ